MPVDRGIDIPNVLRPGFQAPAKAQLNLDLGLGVLTPSPQNQPTTTIRLISNADFSYGGGKNGTPQMQPFKTARVFADDLKARKRVRINSEGENGTPQRQPPKVFGDAGKRARMDSEGDKGTLQLQPSKITSVFGDAGERARMDSEDQLSAGIISNPFSNVDFGYGAGENGTPELQPSKITSVFGNAVERARMDSEGENGTSELQPFKITSVFGDAGERTRMDSEGQLSVSEGEQKKSGQNIRLEREHEAIRKKLEANRARRRSSAAQGGRKSGKISTGRPSLLGKPKPKPSRLGFLSSARSLVQNVWNRGKAPVPTIASNIPKLTVTNVNASTELAASKAKMGPPSFGSIKRSSSAPAHPTTAGGSKIPIPVKKQRIASSVSTTLASNLSTIPTGANSIHRPPTGRKPRISRSKVIARLALQRAAKGNGDGLNATCGNSGPKLAPRASNYTRRRTRSNLGAKVSRASYGGGKKSRASGEEKVLLSAKKRARKSECARRKSKVVISPLVLDGRYPVLRGMDVDISSYLG